MGHPLRANAAPFRVGLAAGVAAFIAANVRGYRASRCFYLEGGCGFGFPFECGYGFPCGPTAGGGPLPQLRDLGRAGGELLHGLRGGRPRRAPFQTDVQGGGGPQVTSPAKGIYVHTT